MNAGRFKDHAWFVCYAPSGRGQVAIAAIVEHGGHGGSTSAPIARRLLTELKSLGYFEDQLRRRRASRRRRGRRAGVTAVIDRRLLRDFDWVMLGLTSRSLAGAGAVGVYSATHTAEGGLADVLPGPPRAARGRFPAMLLLATLVDYNAILLYSPGTSTR